jgi:hypothetical protein
MENMRLLVSPDGNSAAWIHALDLTTGFYPKYDGWLDLTDLSDDEFEARVIGLQTKKEV